MGQRIELRNAWSLKGHHEDSEGETLAEGETPREVETQEVGETLVYSPAEGWKSCDSFPSEQGDSGGTPPSVTMTGHVTTKSRIRDGGKVVVKTTGMPASSRTGEE